MTPTRKLHDLGQSLWLDNITRELLNSGTLKLYIDDLSVTGLTSNPTIFDNAIKNSAMYDQDISRASSADLAADAERDTSSSYIALFLIALSKIVGFEVSPVTERSSM